MIISITKRDHYALNKIFTFKKINEGIKRDIINEGFNNDGKAWFEHILLH